MSQGHPARPLSFFFEFSKLHRECMQQELATAGLYLGWPMLLCAIHHLNGCSQKELAEELGISPASVAVSLRRMQNAGLILKEGCDEDLRCNRIALSERGMQAFQLSEQILDQMDKTVFSGFAPQEILQLKSFFDRMRANLEQAYGKKFSEVTPID
jgi:DNA-binding MarR family transcriptional regulator